MKRQERLSLFLARERCALNEIVASVTGLCGLYLSNNTYADFKKTKLTHFFKASTNKALTTDVVFHETEWPLPQDFFDLIVIDHLLDFGFAIEPMLKEALRILRQDGTLVITGFNRARLCSRPIRKTFINQKQASCARYSRHKMRAVLEKAGFVTQTQHFDFCRWPILNACLSRILPFLGIGFILIAKRQVVNVKPLDEMQWNFAATKVFKAEVQPEYYIQKQNQHD